MSWYKDGNELEEKEDKLQITTVTTQEDGNELEDVECTLKITNVQIEDDGEYTCMVRNESGERQCAATLTVEGNENVC